MTHPVWKRCVLYGSLTLLLIIGFYLVYLGWIKKDMSDFGVCYQGGMRIRQGETLYRVEDDHLQFKYAPLAAMFFSLFTIVPYEVAKVIWYYLELVLLFGSFFLCTRILPAKEKSIWFCSGIGLMILAKYAGREIELGQVNIFLIFLLSLMVAAIVMGKNIRAGWLWSFSLFFKPYALVFLPYFLLKRRFKLIASGAAMIFIGLFLPTLFFNFQGNLSVLQEWMSTLFQSTPGLIKVYDNASLYAFFLKVFPSLGIRFIEILIALVFLFLALLLIWMMRTGRTAALSRPEILETSYLLVLIPLFSPLGWYYNYLYSLLAVVFLLNYFKRFPPVLRYILVANFVAIGGSLREVLGKSVFRFYNYNSLMVVSYLLILLYLFYSRARKYA
ncbi:MAG: glycosyltransferase family 87 protein [Candidatus Aminicenantales bacterium]